MSKVRHFILGLSIIVIGYFNSSVYAQESVQPYRPINKQDCIRKFDIDEALASEQFYYVVRDNAYLLYDCLSCRAIWGEDILSQNRIFGWMQDDYRWFSEYKFWTDFVIEGRTTQLLLKQCADVFKISPSRCRDFMQAFLAKDPSVCQDDRCKAIMALDEKLDRKNTTKDIIRYIKAISDFDIAKCRNIRDKLFRRMCQAYISQDKKICERYSDFGKFSDLYCSEVLRLEELRQRGK